MKYLVTTINGLEDVCSNEVEELLGAKVIEKLGGKVIFESEEEFLINNLRSITQALLLLDNFEFKNLEEIKKRVQQINLTDHLKNTFMVRCFREGNHEFVSNEVEREIGETIFTTYPQKVDLKKPDKIVKLIIEDNVCFFGIDIAKENLKKRDYRIKLHARSINAVLAYCLVRLSDFKDNQTLLDPFCNDGVICIEAALYKKGRIIGVNKEEGYIKSCNINAKIAKVDVKFIQSDLENLSNIFQNQEVNKIITQIPYFSKNKNRFKKLSKELFIQSKKILNKQSSLIILTQKKDSTKELAELNGFKLSNYIDLRSKDEQTTSILVFEKDLNNN